MTDRIDTAVERAKLAALEGHTPGPWAFNTLGEFGLMSQEDDQSFGMICEPSGECFWPNRLSNARLIAAAPDLLALTDRLLDALDAERARAEKAETALRRVVDEAWNDAVEAAARVQDIAHQEGANAAGQHYAILALKRPEASHE